MFLGNNDNQINMVIDDHKSKTETKYDDKKELLAFSIKLEILYLIFYFHQKLFLS